MRRDLPPRSFVIERTFKGSLHRVDRSRKYYTDGNIQAILHSIAVRDLAVMAGSLGTIYYAVSRKGLGSHNADIASSSTSTRPTFDLISTRELRVSTV